jgi:hypothetical protein
MLQFARLLVQELIGGSADNNNSNTQQAAVPHAWTLNTTSPDVH